MANEIVPVNVIERDFTPEELEQLSQFRKAGMPGLAKAVKDGEEIFLTCFDMYMSGKSYNEITRIIGIPKEVLLFVSEKHKWFEKRLAHYNELASSTLQKYEKSKLETLDTVLLLVSAMNDYFKKEGHKYLKTKDINIIKNFDQKTFAQYLKAIEVVDGLMQDTITKKPEDPKQSTVTINMNSSGTVKQVDENTIDVTSDGANIGDVLATLSKIKKINNKLDS